MVTTTTILGLGMNELFGISAMVNGVVSAVIGFIAFTSSNRTRSIYIFTMYMLAVTIWSTGYFFWMKATNSNIAHFWTIVLNVGSAFIPITYFHWVAESFKRNYHYLFIVGYIIALLCAILSFTNLYVTGFQSIGGFTLWPIAGPAYSIYLSLYLFCSFFGIWIAFSELIRSARNKTKSGSAGYMLFVLILGLFATTNFPLWYGYQVTPIGNLFIFLHVFALGYAMMRDNLMNLGSIAPRLGISFIMLGAVLNIFYSDTPNQYVLRLIILAIVSFFSYLFIETYRSVERERKNVEELVKKLSSTNWELARSNEQLRVMDQRKSEFVSIASHQLRTPVTAIKGYSSLLLENAYGPISIEMREPLSRIFSSSQRLAEMINDFLNVSKIEQGTMTYTYSTFDLKKVVKELVQEFHVAAGEKKLDLEAQIDETKEYVVNADEGKLRQIISNLVDNAIKYTPKGSVRLILEQDLSRGKSGYIFLKIKDTGVGLSQDDLHHLFGKFTRGTDGQKLNTSGSGLGLYVAKKMLQAQHGNIWVDSPGPGKGTVFCVELPITEEKLPK